MTLNFRNIFPTQQPSTHNYLDELLQSNMHIQQQYPQLFQNQDSLFVPDNVHGLNEVKAHLLRCKQEDRYIKKSKQKKNEVYQKQMLQEYLDFLEDNQFMNFQSQTKRNFKERKTLQSSLQCTFKPQILKKSCQLAGNLQPSFERLTMQVRTGTKKLPYKPTGKQMQKQYSRERIQQLSKPRILKTQPSENIQNSKAQTQKKYVIPRSSNYLDVATRNQLWQQQKQIKIQRLRKQEEQNKLKKQMSTFVPKFTDYKGEKTANLSNFGKSGMANYFQRLNLAKSKNNSYAGKQNSSFRKQNMSPYGSNNNSATPNKQKKQTENKKYVQKIKYDEAVKQLHKKLMSLNI